MSEKHPSRRIAFKVVSTVRSFVCLLVLFSCAVLEIPVLRADSFPQGPIVSSIGLFCFPGTNKNGKKPLHIIGTRGIGSCGDRLWNIDSSPWMPWTNRGRTVRFGRLGKPSFWEFCFLFFVRFSIHPSRSC